MLEDVCDVTFGKESGSVWAPIQKYESSEIKLMWRHMQPHHFSLNKATSMPDSHLLNK